MPSSSPSSGRRPRGPFPRTARSASAPRSRTSSRAAPPSPRSSTSSPSRSSRRRRRPSAGPTSPPSPARPARGPRSRWPARPTGGPSTSTASRSASSSASTSRPTTAPASSTPPPATAARTTTSSSGAATRWTTRPSAPSTRPASTTHHVPEPLRGKRVVAAKSPDLDANRAVLALLEAGDPSGARLLGKTDVVHSYPHCWRCKSPVVFRATHQWFIDLGALRDRALTEIREKVEWVPAFGVNRIGAMVENRLEWTISRQRLWGSPITILRPAEPREDVEYYPSADDPAELKLFFDHLVAIFEKHGADAWWDDENFPADAFVPPDVEVEGRRLREGQGHPRRLVRLRRLPRRRPRHVGLRHRLALHRPEGPPRPLPRGARPAPRLVPVLAPHGGRPPRQGPLRHRRHARLRRRGRRPEDVQVDGQHRRARRGHLQARRRRPEALGRLHRLHRRHPPQPGDPDADGRGLPEDPQHGALPPLEPLRLRPGDERRRPGEARARRPPPRRPRGAPRRRRAGRPTTASSSTPSRAGSASSRRPTSPPSGATSARTPSSSSARTTPRAARRRPRRTGSPRPSPSSSTRSAPSPPRRSGSPCRATREPPRTSPRGTASSSRPLTDEQHAAWGRLLDVRAAFVGALEPLRRDGVVGTSAQARAEVEKTAALAADLATTGLDEARFAELLIVPEVVFHAPTPEGDAALPAVSAHAAEGTKCPRCWQVKRDGDDTGLCGRCQAILAATASDGGRARELRSASGRSTSPSRRSSSSSTRRRRS